jgi:hypothetical protein
MQMSDIHRACFWFCASANLAVISVARYRLRASENHLIRHHSVTAQNLQPTRTFILTARLRECAGDSDVFAFAGRWLA